MKSTGIVRKIDELGRVVIPIELRRSLGIELMDPVEIFTESDTVILKKYNSNMTCSITGNISSKNKPYANNKLILSPEGAEVLLRELKEICR